ncbi:MAG: Chitinase [Pedosphaera sp.]|nr:Chitinase [Pedosphaera sp.]
MNKFILSLLLPLTLVLPARAEWPARVFAPYMYLGAGDDFKLTACDDACGLKYYTLAFIIARQDGTGKDATYHKEPAWDGRFPMDQNLYQDQIQAIRKRGGDVIVSFGGEAGKELANVIDDAAQLESAYQKVIDQYKITWLDFDVEGNNLDKGKQDSERRNTVLASLQKKNPGLIISYTLPVDPDGISDASQAILTDAAKKGVKVHSANIMVMYFGKKFINKGKSEGELGVDSANKTHEQLQKIDPAIQIGLCPCLGKNGSKDEVFILSDAKIIKAFADKTPWICSLHYWSINDDAARPRKKKPANAANTSTNNVAASTPAPSQPWAFATLFNSFTSTTPSR